MKPYRAEFYRDDEQEVEDLRFLAGDDAGAVRQVKTHVKIYNAGIAAHHKEDPGLMIGSFRVFDAGLPTFDHDQRRLPRRDRRGDAGRRPGLTTPLTPPEGM